MTRSSDGAAWSDTNHSDSDSDEVEVIFDSSRPNLDSDVVIVYNETPEIKKEPDERGNIVNGIAALTSGEAIQYNTERVDGDPSSGKVYPSRESPEIEFLGSFPIEHEHQDMEVGPIGRSPNFIIDANIKIEAVDNGDREIAVSTSRGRSEEGNCNLHGDANVATNVALPKTVPPGGYVQPNCEPSEPKPVTNVLRFIYKEVVMKMWRKKGLSYHFQKPVNVYELGRDKDNPLPYYDFIKNPMDLGTIKKRLENSFYASGSECLSDLDLMFENAFRYNAPGSFMYKIARDLEELRDKLLEGKPGYEVQVTGSIRGVSSKERVRSNTCKNSGHSLHPSENMEGVPNFAFDECAREPLLTSGGSLKLPKNVLSVSPATLGVSASPTSSMGSTNSKRGKKGSRYRFDETSISNGGTESQDLWESAIRRSKREKKQVERHDPNYAGVAALSEEMKLCEKILKKFDEKEIKDRCTRPFWNPVDTNVYPDYLDVIKTPLDLGDVELKLKHKIYNKPDEFVKDIRLIIRNCKEYITNTADPVLARCNEFQKLFYELIRAHFPERWEWLPDDLYVLGTVLPSEDFKGTKIKTEAVPLTDAKKQDVLNTAKKKTKPPPRRPPQVLVEKTTCEKEVQNTAVSSSSLNPTFANLETPGPRTKRNTRRMKSGKENILSTGSTARATTLAPSAVYNNDASMAVGVKEEPVTPMSLQEKVKLRADILSLPVHMLGPVIKILRTKDPVLVYQQGFEEIEIELNQLKHGTLSELQNYVDSCKRKLAKQELREAARREAVRREAARREVAQVNNRKSTQQPKRERSANTTPATEPASKKTKTDTKAPCIEIKPQKDSTSLSPTSCRSSSCSSSSSSSSSSVGSSSGSSSSSSSSDSSDTEDELMTPKKVPSVTKKVSKPYMNSAPVLSESDSEGDNFLPADGAGGAKNAKINMLENWSDRTGFVQKDNIINTREQKQHEEASSAETEAPSHSQHQFKKSLEESNNTKEEVKIGSITVPVAGIGHQLESLMKEMSRTIGPSNAPNKPADLVIPIVTEERKRLREAEKKRRREMADSAEADLRLALLSQVEDQFADQEFEDTNPNFEVNNPDLEDNNLDLEDASPDIEDKNSDIEDTNSDTKDTNPDIDDSAYEKTTKDESRVAKSGAAERPDRICVIDDDIELDYEFYEDEFE